MASRIGRTLLRQRLGLEGEHEARIVRRGTHFLHLENWFALHRLIRVALALTGLLRRGRRNVLGIRCRRNDVWLPRLASVFDGYTMLQLSDLHLDMSEAHLDCLIESVRGLAHDVCVLTGDFRFSTFGPYAPALDALGRLRPHLGGSVYAVLGNHDTIRMVPGMEALGIAVLMNESVRIDRAGAESAARGFLSGMRKARDLSRAAKIEEILLVYLPFWRVEATVAGWLFGRVRKDKDETKPDEHYVFESMHWNDAAVDVTEFGVHRIVVSRQDLLPFDSQALHAEAMVFEPSESRTAALDEAQTHFVRRARQAAAQRSTSYENIQLLRPEFALVYFPVWIGRYSYRNRTYQVVVDGASGRVMYGKAPGNTLYRAAVLVGGMLLGAFMAIDLPAICFWLGIQAGDDAEGIFVLGVGLLIAGFVLIGKAYTSFRYGEEYEFNQGKKKKGEALLDVGKMSKQIEELSSWLDQ